MQSLIAVTLAKIVAILTSIAMALGISVVPVATSTAPSMATTSVLSSPDSLTPGLNGAAISGKTIWKSYSPKNWGLTFSYETTWNVTASNDANGNPILITMAGTGTSVYVSKNSQVAEPADKTFTKSVQTIAGKNVTVHTYLNPSRDTAFSLYFTIPEGSDNYSFLFQSASSSMTFANDFISLIHS